jgi:RNA polymerase sigma-32 factor
MSKQTSFPRPAELGAYLQAVERYPLLTAAAEHELALQAAAGDRAAADQLAHCSLRFVVRAAMRLRGYGVSLADLVADGNLGLLEAIPRFEPERGLRLWTFAQHYVRSRMLSYVMRHWSVVGLGTGTLANKLFFSLPRERARLRALHGEEFDAFGEIARRFGTSRRRVRAMTARVEQRDHSLSWPPAGRTAPAGEMLPCAWPDAESIVEHAQAEQHLRDRLDWAMSALDARERFIAQRRWLDGDQPTLTELGAQLGVSRERVRQLEARVRGKLRASLVGEHDAAA